MSEKSVSAEEIQQSHAQTQNSTKIEGRASHHSLSSRALRESQYARITEQGIKSREKRVEEP